MINPATYLGALGDGAPHSLQVARGSIPQARAEGAYGRLVASGPVTSQILWPDGAYNIPPAAGVQMSLVSTSANDDKDAGTGIRQNVVGSLKAAAGTITSTNGGLTYAQISAGQTRCTSSARMVPAGKYLYIEAMSAGAISATADAQVEVELVATELDTHQYTNTGIFLSYGGVGLQSSSASLRIGTPQRFSPGTIVAFRTSCDKAATIFGSWFGHLEAIRT